MKRDDIEYILELLNDAMNDKDWDLIDEAYQYLSDFSKNEKPDKYDDEE